MDDASSDESGFEESKEERARSCSPMQISRPALDPLPAIPLSGFDHSLVPDMAFGWRPTSLCGAPIPLLFNRCELPVSFNATARRDFPTVFHGFRPRDSLAMHQTLAKGGYTVPHYPSAQIFEFLHKKDYRFQDTRPFVGMSPENSCDLEFDSTFEGGNLDRAVQVAQDEYELYMRADANTRGHHQWYYFSVTAKRTCVARFNILNFTKNESLYSQGMLPVVFLEQQPDLGWHRAGQDVKYGPSKLNRLFVSRRAYFTLSFSYQFRPSNKVFFAYAVPYTYSFLCKSLDTLTSAHPTHVRREVLCKSLSGLSVPVVTVTNFRTGIAKPHVVMMGRIHPGETHGSWMLHGLLHFLLGDTPTALSLRDKLAFVVVPMINPDGVVMGNYRTGFSGNDLNRQFQEPDPQLHPTVAAMKALVKRLALERDVLAFLDFHAHSKKKHVFLYGPHYPLHSAHYYGVRVLPKLICERGPEFRYVACRFKVDASKQRAARLVIWKEAKLPNCFTIEASFYGYLDQDRCTVPFTTASMETVGQGVAEALLQYLILREEEARQRDARKTRRLKAATMDEVIEKIKIEEQQPQEEESDTSSSSSSSEDDLPLEDQRELHTEILAALQPKPVLRTAKKSESEARRMMRMLPAPRKPLSDRVLEAKLYSLALPLVAEPQRIGTILHPLKAPRYVGLLGLKQGSKEPRGIMRCPQKGVRDVDVRALHSHSPAELRVRQKLWSGTKVQQGSTTERGTDRGWRPRLKSKHSRDLSSCSHNS